MGKRNIKRNRSTKFVLTFDDQERKNFLTGFSKRKQERRVKAKEKLDRQLKEEKQRVKKEQREKEAKLYVNQVGVPEVEHLIEDLDVHETEDHVVTISQLDTDAMMGQLGYGMGQNTGALLASPEEIIKAKKDKKRQLNVEAIKQKKKNKAKKALRKSKDTGTKPKSKVLSKKLKKKRGR